MRTTSLERKTNLFLSALLWHDSSQTSANCNQKESLNIASSLSPILSYRRIKKEVEQLEIDIDLSKSRLLISNEYKLLEKLEQAWLKLGFLSRICIAPTLGSAWAIAHFSAQSISVLNSKELRSSLASLPLAALRLNETTILDLAEVNIHRIGELYPLSPKALFCRFPNELLKRLDQAFGYEQELIVPSPITNFPILRAVFDPPIDNLTALLAAAQKLLTRLLSTFTAVHQAPANILIELKMTNKKELKKEITLSFPSMNLQHLSKLLLNRIEALYNNHRSRYYEVTTNTITSLGIGSSRYEYSPPENKSFEYAKDYHLTDSQEQREQIAILLDQLKTELGEERVLELTCNESYLPEKAFSFSPFRYLNTHRSQQKLIEGERPSLLYYDPQPIKAMSLLPDRPPFWLKWQGKTYKIKKAEGPERIAPPWWGKEGNLLTERDYFRLQLTTGIWLWVYREAKTASWYLHGIWA